MARAAKKLLISPSGITLRMTIAERIALAKRILDTLHEDEARLTIFRPDHVDKKGRVWRKGHVTILV